MADILIRGMEMPNGCFYCPIGAEQYFTGSIRCPLLGKRVGYFDEVKNKRDMNCPLVPLPKKHGRLIDADAFKAMCLSATKEAKPDFIRHEDWLKSCAITTAFCRDIDEAPTIIPAEGVTDDVQKQ